MKEIMEHCEAVIVEIRSLFEKFGGGQYTIGEDISQMEHAVQCAMRGLETDQSLSVAGLLHDIGHLMGMRDELEKMFDSEGQDIGAKNHEHIAADWLAEKGFPESVFEPVRMHCDAKRYLMTTDSSYTVSQASLSTFVHQGGYMSREEIAKFEANPHFEIALRLRRNEENAKIVGVDAAETLEQFNDFIELTRFFLLTNLFEAQVEKDTDRSIE
jgi:predicted HD phosphohydrolase